MANHGEFKYLILSLYLIQCLLVVLIFSLVDILKLSLLKVVASYSLDIRHGLYLI